MKLPLLQNFGKFLLCYQAPLVRRQYFWY